MLGSLGTGAEIDVCASFSSFSGIMIGSFFANAGKLAGDWSLATLVDAAIECK